MVPELFSEALKFPFDAIEIKTRAADSTHAVCQSQRLESICCYLLWLIHCNSYWCSSHHWYISISNRQLKSGTLLTLSVTISITKTHYTSITKPLHVAGILFALGNF